MTDPAFYQRVIDDIRAKIASGEWPAGSRIPPTPELTAYYAERLGKPDLSSNTIRKAVEILKDRGELRGQQGVGVYVKERP